MFEGVISSKTKANILVKLFLNPGTRSYLRELSTEFGVSTNAVRTELNVLKKNKILVSHREGRNVYYMANSKHSLFPELSSMVRKITGIDGLVHSVVERLGNLEEAYLVGDYACGRDTGVIDVVLIGRVNGSQLEDIIRKAERYVARKIRPLVLKRSEFIALCDKGMFKERMKLWNSGNKA